MSADWSVQRTWEDLVVGQLLPVVAFPLSLQRLVVEAGANRDFNSIHHNSEYARASGAPDAYANTLFLLGMWERAVREFVGLDGEILAITGFRMHRFNVAGDVVTVRGRVARIWMDDGAGLAELEVRSENRSGLSVGPGRVTISLPRAAASGAEHE